MHPQGDGEFRDYHFYIYINTYTYSTFTDGVTNVCHLLMQFFTFPSWWLPNEQRGVKLAHFLRRPCWYPCEPLWVIVGHFLATEMMTKKDDAQNPSNGNNDQVVASNVFYLSKQFKTVFRYVYSICGLVQPPGKLCSTRLDDLTEMRPEMGVPQKHDLNSEIYWNILRLSNDLDDLERKIFTCLPHAIPILWDLNGHSYP